MDNPFQFDRYVTGKYFISRRKDCDAISSVINSGGNAAILAPHGSGKMSAVQQVLYTLKIKGIPLQTFNISLANIRSTSAFIHHYRKVFLKEDTTSDISVTDEYMAETAELPYRIAESTGKQIVVIFNEFHCLNSDDGESMIKALETAAKAHYGDNKKVSLIFIGSAYNAMEQIFRKRKFFFNVASLIELSDIPESEIADHIMRGFMAGGKVIDRDLLLSACRLFGNNIWYINNFFFICDSLSKGYISELTFSDALSCMLSVHTPRFMRIMDSLTDYQERMLKATLDGVMKFSTTEVLEKYNLRSSANVKRLKDALMKKEVLAFNDKDEPFLTDPLFKYWLTKYYFGEQDSTTLKWGI